MSGRGLGGGDRRAIEILKRFKLRGISIKIVTSRMGYNSYKNYLNTDYVILPFSSVDKLGVIISYLVRTILACFLTPRSKRNDILYATSDFLPDVFPAFVIKSRNKNAKWFQVIHHLIPSPSKRRGSFFRNFTSYYMQKVSFFFIKHFADSVIVVNPLLAKELEQKGFDKKKIRLGSNGVDLNYLKRIQPVNKKLYDAMFLGRLHPSKGIFDLVTIWKEVCKKKPSAKLVLIGSDGKMEDELKKRIMEAGLVNNIDIMSNLEDYEVFKIMKSSRIFVFPSYEEGWGISICEAMACGLPVVAWDQQVYSKIFPKGILKVPVREIKSFADAVLKILANNQLRNQMKKDAIEVASMYDWDNAARNELMIIIGEL
jgi:glycosyltransferase involved in cell wall biosynthesis